MKNSTKKLIARETLVVFSIICFLCLTWLSVWSYYTFKANKIKKQYELAEKAHNKAIKIGSELDSLTNMKSLSEDFIGLPNKERAKVIQAKDSFPQTITKYWNLILEIDSVLKKEEQHRNKGNRIKLKKRLATSEEIDGNIITDYTNELTLKIGIFLMIVVYIIRPIVYILRWSIKVLRD